MIAIGLMIIIAVYVGLFVIAGVKGKTWSVRASWWALLILPLVILTWDMPAGYYLFRHTCETEGGLRIYVPAQRATRLRLGPEHFYKANAEDLLQHHPGLLAVDAKDTSGKVGKYFEYTRAPDGKTIVGKPLDDQAPSSTDAENRGANYVLEYGHDELSYRRFVDRFDLKRADGTLVARWTTVGFRWTNPARTLFGQTQVSYCHDESLPYDRLIRLFTE